MVRGTKSVLFVPLISYYEPATCCIGGKEKGVYAEFGQEGGN